MTVVEAEMSAGKGEEGTTVLLLHSGGGVGARKRKRNKVLKNLVSWELGEDLGRVMDG